MFGALGQFGTALSQSRSRINTGELPVFWDFGTPIGGSLNIPMGLVY
jgi:hypothetical protein